MGFFLSEDQHSGFKQHLNLSSLAWAVIESDMHHFYGHAPSTLSGFLNAVFTNFYQDSKATISCLMSPVREHLNYLFDIPEIRDWANNPVKERIYDSVVDLRAKEYLKVATSYPKGEGRKFRVNQANQRILEDLEDVLYYNNNVGPYLKAVFEDYARKPYHEREAIFYRQTINTIHEAIEHKWRLKLVAKGSKTYLVNAFCLSLDKYSAFNYLVGLMAEASDKTDATLEMLPRSIRLSHIEEIKMMHSQSGRIPEVKRAMLETLLNERGPTFASTNQREIIVCLDDEGIALYKSNGNRSPTLVRKLDPYHYIFFGTEREVEDYFLIYGNHAKVLGLSGNM